METAQLPVAVTIKDYEPLNSSTIRGKFAVVLGGCLILLTCCLWYVAWGELPTHVERPNVSPNLFALFAFCFFGAPGSLLVYIGIADIRNQAKVRDERMLHPDEPWHWDYQWQTDGTYDIGLRQASKGLLAWVLGLGIILPINYIFIAEADFSFAILGLLLLGLFDLVLLLSFGTVVYRLVTQSLHGRWKVSYQRFPLCLGERIELMLEPHPAFSNLEELNITLRCVEELCEVRRTKSSGTDAVMTMTFTKAGLNRYSEEQSIRGEALNAQVPIPLIFELPDEPQLQTRLSHLPSIHWELLVVGKRPGIDIEKRFLLPVY